MQRVMTAAIALLALWSGVVEAQQFPGYGPPYFSPYPSPYGPYRPQDPSNARGVPPAQLPPAQPARQATAPPPPTTLPAHAAAPSNPATSAAPTGIMPGPNFPMAPTGFAPPVIQSAPPQQAPAHVPAATQAPAQAPVPAPAAAPPSAYPYGSFPGWSPPYAAPNPSPWSQPAAPPAPRAPRLEVELGERQAYVQENVLLRLKVISEQSLTKATPELPSGNDLILQKLEEPKASSRTAPDGHREIVTEFVYALTPLRAGDLSLPAPRVTGETAGDAYGVGRGQRFEVSSSEGLRLQVRPALTSVQPWLPLRALSLKASLDDHNIKAGEPVSLVLDLDAIGAGGSQLPSLESYLESPDFRVYREQTLTEAKVSADGQRLEGKRSEHYTLVPRADGRLRLPELRLPWWNVTTGSREWVSLPAKLGGGGVEGVRAVAHGEDSGSGWLWLSLSSLLLPLIGFAAGLRYRGRLGSSRQREPLGASFGRRARAAAGLARRRLARARDRLHPAPVWRRLGQNLKGLLPASSRFLFCLSAANREPEPAVWARRFQSEACRHLPGGVQATEAGALPGLAGQVLRLRPGANPDQVIRLLRQLDGALYGGQDIDFRRWKRDFARQVGRVQGLFRARGGKPRLERPRLPALNPSPA